MIRIITLYSNRKYYDKSLRGHVNLLDILQAVKDGDNFGVRTKDGRDITEKVINAAIHKHLVIPYAIARTLVQDLYEVEKANFLPKENKYDRL